MAVRIRKPSPERAQPIDRLMTPIQAFMRIEAAGGILLLACTVAALAWANSPWGDSYDHFWHTACTIGFGDLTLEMSLAHFVNDGLMAVFFFVVGLEIKRELIAGELASFRKAAVPIAAALGGMIVPALIFAGLNRGEESLRGWAIPMATDIAFAVGIMALLGKRVPLSLKVFLTALAIVDDLGAVLVIALFYTSDISLVTLAIAAGFVALSVVANRLGIRTPVVYAIIGACLWLMLLKSGVHATIGGVLLALTIPARVRIRGSRFTTFARESIDNFEAAGGGADEILSNPERQSVVHALEVACADVLTPLNRLEYGLHGWVAFAIMPIFALANAGLSLGAGFGDAVGSGLGIGVVLGLVIGKPLGITLFTAIAVKSGIGELPKATNWVQLVAAGFLAGIGFTMSLFITNLAFRDSGMLQLAKAGILAGSFVAALIGLILLRVASKAPDSPASYTDGS